jgi:hypothetical protein
VTVTIKVTARGADLVADDLVYSLTPTPEGDAWRVSRDVVELGVLRSLVLSQSDDVAFALCREVELTYAATCAQRGRHTYDEVQSEHWRVVCELGLDTEIDHVIPLRPSESRQRIALALVSRPNWIEGQRALQKLEVFT